MEIKKESYKALLICTTDCMVNLLFALIADRSCASSPQIMFNFNDSLGYLTVIYPIFIDERGYYSSPDFLPF